MSLETAVALNRFGLGSRPGEAPPADSRAWLTRQFADFDADGGPMLKALPATSEYGRSFAERWFQARPTDKTERQEVRESLRKEIGEHYRTAVNARAEAALTTSAPFVERLVHFWSNHFAVSANGLMKSAFVPFFERDAIRPHVLGKFEDMLLAVERHPAMLIYLDQVRSVGPESQLARRATERNPQRKRGLNENLAREAMELHTLGVRSGYTQRDVTEFAQALTGWSVAGFGPGAGNRAVGEFVFRPNLHEPGKRSVLGKSYPDGAEQARAILGDLAHSPATARNIATKLARHFAGDEPPPAMVERLAQTFTSSRGDLPSLYAALVHSDEAWSATPAKFKTPWEWTISALRGTGRTSVDGVMVAGMLQQLGQPVWKPGSPAGWSDTAATWAAPDALMRRVELAQRLARQTRLNADPRTLAPALLHGTLSKSTAAQIAGAESVETGIALLLVSPEFQRR